MRPTWRARRARAIELQRQRPHAEELLGFYIELIELQEPVSRATDPYWLAGIRSTGVDDFPLLRLDALPVGLLADGLRRFAIELADRAPGPISEAARRIEAATPTERADLLLDVVEANDGTARRPSHFVAAGFLLPTIEALAARDADDRMPGPWTGRTCPRCGGRPLLSVLHDTPEVQGRRSLYCGRCSELWSFARLTCPTCGCTESNELSVHTAESAPHVRVEGCGRCHVYMKGIDLRVAGRAVPVVDEVATPELDVWAVEQGLEKAQLNLLHL